MAMLSPFSGPQALGEKPARSGRRVGALRRERGKTSLPPEKFLGLTDELMTILVDDAPWEQRVMEYHGMKLRHEGVEAVVDVEESAEERTRRRCEHELSKPPAFWMPITMDTIKMGHAKRSPGMFYGLEFPWNEAMLAEFGPAWLTKAFHAAGTMPKNNRVMRIILQSEIKVTGGNNAGKFLFEVKYARESPNLSRHLFAKVPFAMTAATTSDRLSSSFYKQPMDMMELNTYRVLESALPFPVPRFYFGDISNETTNFILITERVPFSEIRGFKSRSLKQLEPFEVEGPYDKCKDFTLRGPQKEYYLLLLRQQARIAGKYKLGQIPDIFQAPPTDPGSYGLNPGRATGENPGSCAAKLESGIRFMAETAKALFPSYVTEEAFQSKYKSMMMKLNAYTMEINFWKNSKPDYVGLGHQNLNVDNAYFWRGAEGELDCGIFDFGGFSVSSLPHKIWWMLNMAEFDQMKENLPEYIEAFCTMYQECGGPELDRDEMYASIILTAMQNAMIMVSALPNSLKMCPTKEWLTIKDRHDPRIAANVDNKSTLRTNIHVLVVTARVLEEMGADRYLEEWIAKTWAGAYGQAAKSEAAIGNTEGHTETTRW